MREIVVLIERAGNEIDETAWELSVAARGLGEAEGPVTVSAAVLGQNVSGLTDELTRWFDTVHVFDHPDLQNPDAEHYAALLVPLVEKKKPYATLIPHTNTGMDLAPVLAVRTDASLLADCLSLESRENGLGAVRTVYGGKVQARILARPSAGGFVATVRPGAFAIPESAPGVNGTVETEAVADDVATGRRFVETVAPEPGAVDISQCEVLVAVGRGIEEEENLEVIQSLAETMGAEVACSRPVVDKNWLPKSRQVGTSGVTVKPKIYIAVGISGSFQHMGGIKGGPFIVAINKDPAAPIFSVADVGIVGDLFDLVPLLEEKLEELKG